MNKVNMWIKVSKLYLFMNSFNLLYLLRSVSEVKLM